jgi:hypothetical protein
MKLYLVRGEHPDVPGMPTKATFDPEQADAFAAELVNKLAPEVAEAVGWSYDEAPKATADEWKEALLWCQALRYQHDRAFLGVTFDEARAAVTALAPDERAEEADCDVWIEEFDVVAPRARVVIDMTGGCFQGGWSEERAEVVVLDYDPGDGWDKSDAIEIAAGGRVDVAQALVGSMTKAPEFVAHVFSQAESQPVISDINPVVAVHDIENRTVAADGPYRAELANAFREAARELCNSETGDRIDVADDALIEEGEGGVIVHCTMFVSDSERKLLAGECE